MVFGDVFEVAAFLFVAAIVVHNVRKFRREKRDAAEAKARGEALFQSMFPDLQPWFHPLKVIGYVAARRGRAKPRGGERWQGAPGFGVDAEIDFVDGKERVTLLDDSGGGRPVQFLYQEQPDGGVLRIGKGKMTVTLPTDGNHRVRYWHPEREFKWKRGAWTFDTRMSDSSIESSSNGTSFSDSSPSTSSVARGAAAAAGVAAGSGTFDGGGASAAWDGGSDSGSGGGFDASGGSDAFAGGSAGATSY